MGSRSRERNSSHDGYRIATNSSQQSVPYALADDDLVSAGALLDAAGYPLVGGWRPSMGDKLSLQIYVAEAGEVSLDVGDTINTTWQRLGISASLLNED